MATAKEMRFGETIQAFRKWTRSLGDYVEGSQAQKNDIAFWLPRFVAEFGKHGVTFDAHNLEMLTGEALGTICATHERPMPCVECAGD